MIVVDSPQRLSVKSSLKRSLERDSSNKNSDKLTKRPKYCGTIYEAMLAPISPVTTLPIHTVYKNSVKCEPEIQNDFLDLVALGKRAKLEKFLEENIDSININQYNKDGLTPLQTVAQEGGETSADIGELLVRYGADTRLTSRDGWSAVHMATFSGNTRLMMFLLTCRPWWPPSQGVFLQIKLEVCAWLENSSRLSVSSQLVILYSYSVYVTIYYFSYHTSWRKNKAFKKQWNS